MNVRVKVHTIDGELFVYDNVDYLQSTEYYLAFYHENTETMFSREKIAQFEVITLLNK